MNEKLILLQEAAEKFNICLSNNQLTKFQEFEQFLKDKEANK